MPKIRTPYSNVNTEEALTGRELVQEIAARTHVKDSVVEMILREFKEVATEEIVNKGGFHFSGLFTVKNFGTKEAVTPRGVVPAQKKLSIRLSDRVKKLWNFKQKSNDKSAKTFIEMLDDFSAGLEAQSKPVIKSSPLSISIPEPDNFPINPMLDYSDEE